MILVDQRKWHHCFILTGSTISFVIISVSQMFMGLEALSSIHHRQHYFLFSSVWR